VTAGAFASIAAACSLTTSLAGFSGGPDGDAGDADARSSTTDGGPNMDGGDGSAATFACTDYPGAVFCSDFESVSVTTGWSSSFANNGGSIEAGEGRFGRGLLARVPTRGSTPTTKTRPNAALEKALSLAPRQPFTVSFDMNIEPGSGGGVVDLGGIYFPVVYYVVTFRMENDGTIHMHEYGAPTGNMPEVVTDKSLLGQPPKGTWLHVVMKTTFPTGADAHLTITFDGTVVYDDASAASRYADQKPSIYAGVSNAESAGQAQSVRFDDVLVTTP
jgi:hypothetical protein